MILLSLAILGCKLKRTKHVTENIKNENARIVLSAVVTRCSLLEFWNDAITDDEIRAGEFRVYLKK